MEECQSTTIRGKPSFKKGSSVEVRSDDPGFVGSWYEATITQTPKRLRSRYTVRYKTLLSTISSSRGSENEKASMLEEKVCMSMVRPASPYTRDRNAVFEEFQEVEAFHNEGWWPGVILKKMNEISDDGSSIYSVAFPLSREKYSFRAYDLRKKMVWVADDQGYSWRSDDELSSYDNSNQEELYKKTFHEGTRVEVSYDKDNYGASWFVATILKLIGGTYCLVEYDTVREDSNDCTNPLLQEVIDMQYIRPCPPMNMSRPVCFKKLDMVEAFYNSGWFMGVVSTVISDSKYMVRISGQNKVELESFDCTALRIPLAWEDGQWGEISQDKDIKVVHKSNGQNFKRMKTREAVSVTDDQLTQPLKKLKKFKGKNGDKSRDKSSPSHGKDGKSLAEKTAFSFEKRTKFREDCHYFHQKRYSTSNSSKKTILCTPQNPSPLADKGIVIDPKELNSACRENAMSIIVEPRTENGTCAVEHYENNNLLILSTIGTLEKNKLEDIAYHDELAGSSRVEICELNNHDTLDMDHSTENESISDKVDGFASSKALPVKENVTPFVPCSQTISDNFETPISRDKMSEMIETVESAKEVLRMFPQDPHFQPLLTHEKAVQKGLSYGLMIAFAGLVTSVKELSIDASDYEFEEKFKALNYMEEHGFSTQPIRARLEKLKEVHDKLTQSQGKKTSTLLKVEELKKKKEGNDSKVLEIEGKITRLDNKRKKMISESKKIDMEIEELRSIATGAEEESCFIKLKFGEMSKLLW